MATARYESDSDWLARMERQEKLCAKLRELYSWNMAHCYRAAKNNEWTPKEDRRRVTLLSS